MQLQEGDRRWRRSGKRTTRVERGSERPRRMLVVMSGKTEAGAYTIANHRHHFAVWAASRAAQRGLKGASTRTLTGALEACGVVDVVAGASEIWPSTQATFDIAHQSWCTNILRMLEKAGVKGATFGRAAKLVAIYLKTTVVLAGHEDTPFARVLHPPIDQILLTALARDERFDRGARRRWKMVNWTQLDEVAYSELVRDLRDAWRGRPFWTIEQYWR